jgi:hypothetical protein
MQTGSQDPKPTDYRINQKSFESQIKDLQAELDHLLHRFKEVIELDEQQFMAKLKELQLDLDSNWNKIFITCALFGRDDNAFSLDLHEFTDFFEFPEFAKTQNLIKFCAKIALLREFHLNNPRFSALKLFNSNNLHIGFEQEISFDEIQNWNSEILSYAIDQINTGFDGFKLITLNKEIIKQTAQLDEIKTFRGKPDLLKKYQQISDKLTKAVETNDFSVDFAQEISICIDETESQNIKILFLNILRLLNSK